MPELSGDFCDVYVFSDYQRNEYVYTHTHTDIHIHTCLSGPEVLFLCLPLSIPHTKPTEAFFFLSIFFFLPQSN